jgi:hypothetical protein
MSDANGTPAVAGVGVVDGKDYRINQAGLIAPQTSSLAVRTGVMIAPGSTALVTGTAATGTMTVSIAAHHWVTTRGTADGIYLGAKEAAGTVNIAAAPGANSRIDVVYVRQTDASSTISPDAATAEEYGVVTGTAAASPTKPPLTSVPGAVELATVTVAVGATATNGANVTINNTALQVSARGARVWVHNQAERDALTAFPGLEVYRIDTGAVETYPISGSTWASVIPGIALPRARQTSTLTGKASATQVGFGTTAELTTTANRSGFFTEVADGIQLTLTGLYAVNVLTQITGTTSAGPSSQTLFGATDATVLARQVFGSGGDDYGSLSVSPLVVTAASQVIRLKTYITTTGAAAYGRTSTLDIVRLGDL